MYLKRIEIAGFKSFADRTKIEFEQGVTAVIGPNGSGKSNITEAIRWVLGEQSAKSLRGGKMPDIIFAGSDSRKQLNIAEVTVVLDNTDNYLPLGFSEVSVTRRYRRTGESDFFINKKACRLKDIQDLFMDSGLGKESFSIISQGKVEAIFASKPEDRRGIFEEAAGVLKYKQRKRKAEQKLFETEDNLSRVQDIIYELEDQLTPLAAQSEAAKEFLALKKELTVTDVSLTVAKIKRTRDSWQSAKTDFDELSKTVEEKGRFIQETEMQLGVLREKRGSLDEQLETGQQQLLHLSEALKQAEGQKELLSERSKNTQKTSAEYQTTLTDQRKKRDEAQLNLQDVQTQQADKQAEKIALEEKIRQLTAESEKYKKSPKELLEDLRGTYVELMQEAANVSNELKYLERQYTQETAKNQQSMTRFEALREQLEDLTAQQTAAKTKSQSLEVQLTEEQEDYRRLAAEKNAAQQQLQKEQQLMYDLMNQVQQARARQKSLQDIQENYSGFYQGVRSVLQHKDQLSGIVGAVAELIQVPKEYTLAIETALGAAAQHIIVENEKDARQGITFLKKQRSGRGTFLPLTTIKPRSLGAHQYQAIKDEEGFLGVASELVAFQENVAPVMQNLLGAIVIAKDLNSANQLARLLRYQVRVVSLDGDVMNAGGSMTGGAMKQGNRGNLFNQGHELAEWTKRYEEINQTLQAKEKFVRELQTKVAEQTETLETLRTQGEQTRLAYQEAQSGEERVSTELTRLQKEQTLFSYEAKELESFLKDYQTQKDTLEFQQVELKTQQEKINQEIQQLNEESDQLEEKRASISAELSRLQADYAVLDERLLYLERQALSFEEQINELTRQITSLENQILALSSDSSDHEESEESLNQRLTELATAREHLQEQLNVWKETRQSLQKQVDQSDSALTEANREQKQLLARQSQADVQKNRYELKLDNALTYLQEEYSLTFEGAEAQADPDIDQQSAQNEVSRLKQAIEKLGPVNLNAIEQYQQVEERYDFLTTQRDDLLSAKDQLFETMDEMDDEVKTRFYTTFEAIREKFNVVFPNMFGGGRAELVLTNPDDLLNTGIEIEAQPPGKKLQSLSLLSGGERALTAIALLFSIIQVRPVPFCVLDEVEAALDEANVSRFGRYLSAFQDDTQFIVVTHRKGTMEAADVLYGVTMQESGVSKIISVRLEEVKEDGKFQVKEGKPL
ncbi:chromosome segregation protein SMC [Enterococcus hulanensis]|uniref:Chromosome partition protein Smc n=1 Tax=Enterococcus hulanensis TaxID=2559929 RepID=A0ABU3F0U2_9ENTE|nr:chromosome segregation protein SMC [Enterococcus hulanensis]MDT2600754.1 chromosome segregation protein SMC [Enterococcus hulanensis]MDT2610277.1 chromosome segregation protein SMC [Enterococcus hulanensis]MDT2617315.1 chromosome segregation protein SMC [Enterococcus hulanensis]MDT2628222.1 chromosome segregation protein SMC [Enterococcus hulanensis]MDT2655327.1 chromosome segregation protein SMC [Enterococcus hulanensis]